MQFLIILLLVFSVPASVLAFWIIRRNLALRRRVRLRAQPARAELVDTLMRNVSFYGSMPAALKSELHGHINVFLDEKRFVGCNGLEVTNEMMFTVAGMACVLLLNREPSYFPGFSTILMYPDTFESMEVSYDGDVEIHERTQRAGESWYRGPVILSWGDVLRGGEDADDGFNVVLHEFAHKLDEENGGADGLPILRHAEHYERWAEVLGREFVSLDDRVADADNEVIDEYGLTSPAEFFAVATESFFEKPAAMRRHLPELYEQLQHFYAVDPAAWQADVQVRDR